MTPTLERFPQIVVYGANACNCIWMGFLMTKI